MLLHICGSATTWHCIGAVGLRGGRFRYPEPKTVDAFLHAGHAVLDILHLPTKGGGGIEKRPYRVPIRVCNLISKVFSELGTEMGRGFLDLLLKVLLDVGTNRGEVLVDALGVGMDGGKFLLGVGRNSEKLLDTGMNSRKILLDVGTNSGNVLLDTRILERIAERSSWISERIVERFSWMPWILERIAGRSSWMSERIAERFS